MNKEIIFIPRAKLRLLQRGLNEETTIEVIRSPEYLLKSFSERKIAVKKIGGKLWHVVYVEAEKIIKVVTAYYE